MKKIPFPKTNQLGLHFGPIISEVDYRLDSYFNKSKPVLIIMLVVVAGIAWIGIDASKDAIKMWRNLESLFDLTGAIFMTCWSVLWMVSVIVIALVCFTITFGRLVVLVHDGKVELIIGVPGFGGRLSFNASEVKEVSLVPAEDNSIFPQEGMQIKIHTFDEDQNNSAFGSNMTQEDVDDLWSALLINKNVQSDLDGKLLNIDETSTLNTNYSQFTHQSIEVEPVTLTSPSTVLLILANLVPILGVLFYNWDLAATMVLFWAETAIILFYNVIKGIYLNPIIGIFFGLITIAKTGAFMAIHFLFIWAIFVEGFTNTSGAFELSSLGQVADYLYNLWPALLALLFSHGMSFKTNFLNEHQENIMCNGKDSSLKQENDSIQSRIVLMHITIIIGAAIALALNSNVYALLLLITMKLAADIRAHLKKNNRDKPEQ